MYYRNLLSPCISSHLLHSPTPVEDLTPGGHRVKREHLERSDDVSVKKKRSTSELPPVISKPTLFQAVPTKSSEAGTAAGPVGKDQGQCFEWQAMGVYDEEDLIEVGNAPRV